MSSSLLLGGDKVFSRASLAGGGGQKFGEKSSRDQLGYSSKHCTYGSAFVQGITSLAHPEMSNKSPRQAPM